MKLKIKIVSFFLFLLCCSFVFGGNTPLGTDPIRLRIDDFSGGINTTDNMWKIAENQCFQSLNWILDDPIGGLRVRPGYIKAYESATSSDDFYSIYGHRFSNGNSFMFSTIAVSGNNKLWRSGESSAIGFTAPSNQIFSQNLFNKRGYWVSWLDVIYYFDGGYVIPRIIMGGESPSVYFCDLLNPIAPGKPFVSHGNAGNLNGEYIYGYVTEIPCSTTAAGSDWASRCGTLSDIIRCENQSVILSNLYPQINDSMCSAANRATMIVRTRGNSVNYDTDSLFIIDSIFISPSDDPFDKTFTDNVADDNWIAFWKTIKDANIYRWWLRGDNNSAYAPGGMTVLYSDSGSNADTVIGKGGGSHAANLYFMVYLDTINGRYSDSSSNLSVGLDQTYGINRNITLGIPKLPTVYEDRYVRVIYRARITYTWNIIISIPFGVLITIKQDPYTFYALDTITDKTQTTYWDTLGFWTDSALGQRGTDMANEQYSRNILEGIFAGAIVHEARMFAWDRYRVYISKYDTVQFSPIQNIEFDMDDGDRIVGLASYEGYVLVFKTNSIWILYTQDGEVYDRSKRSVDYGMISFATLDQYRGANIYLGKNGVIYENESRYRTNKLNRDYLSDPIRNILLRSVDSMSEAVGVVYDDKYFLSYPGTDTTFVYFFNTGGWSIFNFDFYEATLYDTTLSEINSTFNKLYFVQDLDYRTFLFESGDTTDNTTDFIAVWEKKYISPSQLGQVINSIHLWKEITAQDSVVLTVTIEDNNGNPIDTLLFDSLSYTYDYQFVSTEANDISHWFKVRIEMNNKQNAVIQGLDLNIISTGMDIRR